jgi:hypothetical protein
MALPKIIYDAGSGPTTLQCVRGPQGFVCRVESRKHDNLAASGIRERVVESNDLIIQFTMPSVAIDGDWPAWCLFGTWALYGAQFDFYPDADLADYYHCVSDDEGFEPSRTSPGRYALSFRFRIVPDGQAPVGPGEVLERFYGIGP